MTILLYRIDPYMKSFNAKVMKIENNIITLDKTCFFPQGGGQVGDTGEISGNKVINTLSSDEVIQHILENAPNFSIKEEILGQIDWERRYRIMKLHSAAHLVYYTMQEVFGENCKPASSGLLDDKKDRTDYIFNEPLDKQKLLLVEEKVNNLILDGLPISHLKNNEGRFIWKIQNFEAMECGGTHVKNTKEIGKVNIKRGSKPGKGRERIEITLSQQKNQS
ncbi:alanyl-tRNA editing protein [Candidatus Bathyarchaeota archaeon]|nr:alanyl-tRNA editing protein [Candidatus Bathyarchaeota archaeon]